MLEFYEKRKLKRILFSWPVNFLLLLLLLFLGNNVWKVFVTERETSIKRMERATVLLDLEERKEALERNIETLSTDRGVEQEIRNKFEVSKEGERVIVLVDKKDEENEPLKKRGIFSYILDLF